MRKIHSLNAVICIAAGKSQVPVILKAKTLGYTIIAIDQNKKAPGFDFADFKIFKSTFDSDEIIKELKEFTKKYRIQGILNRSSGPPVIVSAKLSKLLKLEGVPVQSAKILLNKDKMRSFCKKKNIPIPDFKIYLKNNVKVNNNQKLPIVFKPAYSLKGKRGVSVVRSNNLIKKAIKYAEKNTINRKILMEEYLSGPDLTLISIVKKSKLFPVCFIEEINKEDPNGIISRKGYKTINTDHVSWKKQAIKIANIIISELKVRCSPLNLSFRVDSKNNLKLIEVHLDIGGEILIESFFPKVLPIDFLNYAIETLLGNSQKSLNFKTKPTAILFKGINVSDGHSTFTAKTYQLLEKKIIHF